jgi:N-formylglutamate amidohydrolase
MAEGPSSPESGAPFVRVGPDVPVTPVVVSVPHAGRAYRPELLKASRLSLGQLEMLEDRYVDRLVWRALDSGATAIVAHAPRAEIDLNRDEREIDPTLIVPPPVTGLLHSARTRGGLGLIPARIAGAGPIWLHRIQQSELARRIREIHRPYHAAVDAALRAARERFGLAILLDCHSMPPRSDLGVGQAEIVFGDLHGTTIAPALLDAALRASRAAGFRTGCNTPYAGGYITARHGRPHDNVHALQIEVDRSLYLAEDMRTPGPGFERTALLIATVARALAERAAEPPESIAAE